MGAAARQARRLIEARIAQAAAGGSTRLPSVRTLAREAGVSYVTMWSVLQRLRAGGSVVAGQTRRLSVAVGHPAQVPASPEPPLGPARMRIASAIERDVHADALFASPLLPRISDLAARFGADRRTVAAALRELSSRGALLRYGRRYRAAHAVHPVRSGSSVVLVVAGDREGRMRITTYRAEDHLRALEQECAAAGVRLDVVTYDAARAQFGGARPWRTEFVHGKASALGYIVWCVNLTPATARLLVRTAGAEGRPVAVLDESGRGTHRETVAGQRRARLVLMADNYRAAQAVGVYLRRLGHDHVAFVSPYHGADWSRDRLAGLQQAMAAGRSGMPVEPVIAGQGGSLDELVRATCPAIEDVRTRMASAAAEEARGQGIAITGAGLRPSLVDASSDAVLAQVLEPSLAGLAQRPDITAWVCVTDRVALAAKAHIHAAGATRRPLPALTGFDDLFEAFLGGITSFNFNGERAMTALLAHLLCPQTAPRRSGLEPLTIDGYVVERQSTRSGRHG